MILIVLSKISDGIVPLRVRSRFSGKGARQEAFVSVGLGWVLNLAGEIRWGGPVIGSTRGPSIDINGEPTSKDMYLIWSYLVEKSR